MFLLILIACLNIQFACKLNFKSLFSLKEFHIIVKCNFKKNFS